MICANPSVPSSTGGTHSAPSTFGCPSCQAGLSVGSTLGGDKDKESNSSQCSCNLVANNVPAQSQTQQTSNPLLLDAIAAMRSDDSGSFPITSLTFKTRASRQYSIIYSAIHSFKFETHKLFGNRSIRASRVSFQLAESSMEPKKRTGDQSHRNSQTKLILLSSLEHLLKICFLQLSTLDFLLMKGRIPSEPPLWCFPLRYWPH